ncbi:HD domain-containing protein [Actinorugispora endophytica]|uniref:Putative metal-dependent HD superfamily phosphohydrolase n=1 Tax=Actinorugispora endophytica TaxID=1605990 RepID=A0A4R6UY18_9ACTN|nr:metal-dependent phosphohydrolase [Actinorugispora endophytica]TDQ52382.1 putative metal-dependent HD superfamily phosphohydrolase [Actinorugispora endophytica]
MSLRRPDLSDAWRRLAGSGAEATAVGAELLARWAEPHRRYHTLDHLRAVLAGVDELAGEARDASSVRYAAWFHDAVYRGEPGEDEESSARLAELLLPSCGLTEDRAAEVARLVRVTAGHDPASGDADAEVLCDADLAVLAAAPDEYAAYTRAVREEYAHVGAADFARGRAAVLGGLLAAPRLYRTRYGHGQWEARARANLTAEVARLTEYATRFAPSQT